MFSLRPASGPRVLAAALLVLAVAQPVTAQQRPATPPQPPAAPAPIVVTGPTTGWIKACQRNPATNREGCLISLEMFNEGGLFLGSAGIQEAQGETRRRLVVTVPLGIWLEDGIQIRIDRNPVVRTGVGTCLQNGCFGAIDVTPPILQQLRTGQMLSVAVRNPDNTGFDIQIPLTGFAQAYDGSGIDPQTLQLRQQAFQAEMARRASERRQAQELVPGVRVPGVQAPQQR